MQGDISFTQTVDKLLSHQISKEFKEDQQLISELPESLISFLKTKEIPIEQLTIPIPRYIRLKPNFKPSLQELAASLKLTIQQIMHVDDNFYALVPDCKINGKKFYEQSLLYGMDYSSAIPIRCLDPQENHKVLQLCSSPGNKSMYLADMIEKISIKGVQINTNRANVMRNLVKKYNLDDKIQIIVADGIKFENDEKFDRVLVDAECTHEGSIKHIKKFMKSNKGNSKPKSKKQIKYEKWLTIQQQKQFQVNNTNPYTSNIKKLNQWSFQDFQQRFLDKKKLQNLKQLQFGLIQNGFNLLKQDGIMVYSTCSFDFSQNQDIVQELLDKNPSSKLMNADESLKCRVKFQKGKLKETIKFSPSVSRCGGMFVAKIKKMKKKQKQ